MVVVTERQPTIVVVQLLRVVVIQMMVAVVVLLLHLPMELLVHHQPVVILRLRLVEAHAVVILPVVEVLQDHLAEEVLHGAVVEDK